MIGSKKLVKTGIQEKILFEVFLEASVKKLINRLILRKLCLKSKTKRGKKVKIKDAINKINFFSVNNFRLIIKKNVLKNKIKIN